MKVTDTKEIRQVQSVAGGESPRGARTGSASADPAPTGEAVRVSTSLAAARVGAAHGRSEKLASIERAVQQGTYRPDPQRIAEEILEDAELAARLQVLFGG